MKKIRFLSTLLLALSLAATPASAAPFGDLTIYHIMVDMFADGNPGNNGEVTGWKHPNYAGGDLQGILAHAQYLQDLGVNAVWLSPIFAARSSHGYDVTNYYQVGSAFAVPGDPKASEELFRKLVADLHQRGIKVILDIPLNHASGSYQRDAGDPDKLHPRATAARQGRRSSGRAGGPATAIGTSATSRRAASSRMWPCTGCATRGSTACGWIMCAVSLTTSGPSCMRK
jgi:hypothetical protein